MSRTITLRLSDKTYELVKHYAQADGQSMNAWVEALLDAEDMRRRCAMHEAWMSNHPHIAAAALHFGQANQATARALGLPNVAGIE